MPEGTEMVTMTMREALRDAMAEEMRRDPDVFVMGEEVAEYQGAYKVTQGLLDEFGARRVIDTPITEHGFAGLGIGAALAGLKPIVEFMTFNFAMQAMDQLINSAAKTPYMSGGQVRVSIVFRGPNGPASRVAAQHSQDYSAWYSHVPGLKVIAPSTAADAKGLLKAAIRDPNPVMFLENEILYGHSSPVPKLDDYVLPIGRARVVRSGSDVTIVAWSMGMTYALKAADELAKENINAEVIDLRTLKPMDSDTIIESVKKTGRLVTVEEGWKQSGVGAEIAARVMEQAFDYLDAPVARVTGKDVPMPYAANLEKLALPSVAEVVEAAKAVCTDERRSEQNLGQVRPLAVPPPALEQGGYEVLRAVISEGQLHVSLRRAFDEPETWGILLADIARHLGRIYARETSMREDQVVEKVWAMFEAEMDRATDIGTTSSVS